MSPVAPTLSTTRLELRWLTSDDASLMLDVWNNPDFVRSVGDRGVRTLDDARAALEQGALSMYAERGYGPFRVGLKDGTGIGICGLFERAELDAPDIGFALLPEWYRRGYGFESAQAVLAYCDQTLRLPRVLAIVSPGNYPSMRLLEKLGMQRGDDVEVHGDRLALFERERAD